MNNQLSYFIVLQNAAQGGELTLYDTLWENVKKKDDPKGNQFLIDEEGKKMLVNDLRHTKIKPEPGDILVFHGGPIWHRVEDIQGSTPRITLGGFLNFSKDGSELFYWS